MYKSYPNCVIKFNFKTRSKHWYLTRPAYLYHFRHKFKFCTFCFKCSDPIKEPFGEFRNCLFWSAVVSVPHSVLNTDILFLCCSHFHLLLPPFDLLQYIKCVENINNFRRKEKEKNITIKTFSVQLFPKCLLLLQIH